MLAAVAGLLLWAAPGTFGQLVRQPNTTLVLSPSSPPATLSATGAFADLATLTPNAGIVSYKPNLSFWSDYAQKSRWFSIPGHQPNHDFLGGRELDFPDRDGLDQAFQFA